MLICVIFVIPCLKVYPLWEINHLGELLSLHPGLQFTDFGWTISNSQQGTYTKNVVHVHKLVKCCVQRCSLWSQQASFKALWNTAVRTHGVELQTRLIQWRFQSSRLTFLANSALSCLTKQGFTVQWSLLIKLKNTVKPVGKIKEQNTLHQAASFIFLFYHSHVWFGEVLHFCAYYKPLLALAQQYFLLIMFFCSL